MKIEAALAYRPDTPQMKVGVLSRNSYASETESPIAVVAEFEKKASDLVLRELHRLAWNFSHSPTVVTIEPDLLRVWTCCEPPEDRLLGDYVVHDVSASELARPRLSKAAKRTVQVLHWANMVSGQFFLDHAERFKRDQRADRMLLGNLRHLRDALRDAGLTNDDVCHDLLARVIFVQFLFDRKDSAGSSALNQTKLKSLKESGVLNAEHASFSSILEDYEETYRLFDWLNDRFNGDLFPNKGDTREERERAWQWEKRFVKSRHLEMLRDFVRGDLEMPTGQKCLWPQYAFDAIPLEFISSIYEAFVTKPARSEGIYYTPPHLVDFVLDRVLPWGGDRWELKVLDPACGSGIFLVKAFQRLIHRWKKAHPGEDIRAEALRGLLQDKLFGVDKDPHAVRVASFSLYLAMCDEIDPKHYWTQVRFPPMRGCRLINSDFFQEDRAGFRSGADAGSYDVVLGNVPWGGDPLTKLARQWATEHQWPVAENEIGTLFLPKALALTKPKGSVSMIQPSRVLLFSRRGPAIRFREKLFGTFNLREAVNLSALRFELFANASDPACVVTMVSGPPEDGHVAYMSPKRISTDDDIARVVIEPGDVRTISYDDAVGDSLVWSTLVWGGHRDAAFIRRLRNLLNLEQLQRDGVVRIRRGFSRGDRRRTQPQILNRRTLEMDEFPEETFQTLDSGQLPVNTDGRIHSRDSTDFSAFALPQMIVKQSWQKGHFRFQAAIVKSTPEIGPVFCSRSYASVHTAVDKQWILDAAWLSLRSKLAVYFLLLTSGRFAAYREEPNLEDILRVPIAQFEDEDRSLPSNLEDLDARVREVFDFKDSEWVLIEDLFTTVLPDFKGDQNSPGRQRTRRRVGAGEEPQLRRYCEYFIRVLRAGFGRDKEICATIFQETGKDRLPYRLVAIHLNRSAKDQVRIKLLDAPGLLRELEELNRSWLRQRKTKDGSIFSQRIARVYEDRDGLPTIYILKPDACRYWTRSMGLSDGDEVAADFARWRAGAESEGS